MPLHPVELGTITITPGAWEALSRHRRTCEDILKRFSQGEWGDSSLADQQKNDASVAAGGNLMAAYRLSGDTVLWISNRPEAMSTVLLLPSEHGILRS